MTQRYSYSFLNRFHSLSTQYEPSFVILIHGGEIKRQVGANFPKLHESLEL